MNCLIWILLLCCCGNNGCGTSATPRRRHEDTCACREEKVEEVCFQVKRDSCDLPPFPTLSRGETCGCESSE